MAVSKTPKARNTKISTTKRDQVFDIIDAVQHTGRREALTQLKDLLDPANDRQPQENIAKCGSETVDLKRHGEPTTIISQDCWRLPFRGLSHQVYAILREEFALTGSFDSALGRLDICLAEHPKQARKLAEERKVCRSKGTNDMRAWTKASDDLLQQSFQKRYEVALRHEAQLSGHLQNATAVDAPAADTLHKGDEDLEILDNDAIRCDDTKPSSTYNGHEPSSDTSHQVFCPDTSGGQDAVSFDYNLWDESGDRQPLYQNANRQNWAPTTSDSSLYSTDLSQRSALCIWKRGAGRKKSWKFYPQQKLPTRRKHKGYRETTPDIDDSCASESSTDIEGSSAPNSAPSAKPAPYFQSGQPASNCRFKRSGRKESAWLWNRSLSILSDDPDDLMPTGRCPLVHIYPRERKSTKVVIQRPEIDKDHWSSRTLKRPLALPKPVIVEPRLLTFSTQGGLSSHLMPKGIFAREKMVFESLLSSIPENLPGSPAKKQKRRGVNKLKIDDFSDAEQLLSFLRSKWQKLLESMAEMKDSIPQGWKGTQESYSRNRRTFQVRKKQLEDLEPVYSLAQKLETRYRRANLLILKEVQKLEMYAVWVEQSQSALVDLSWTMRKQPGTTLMTSSPLLDPSDYSELMRHSIIRYADDFTFQSRHWAIQGISVFMRVTKAYREWCQMSENLIKSLLNSRKTVAT